MIATGLTCRDISSLAPRTRLRGTDWEEKSSAPLPCGLFELTDRKPACV